MQKAEAELAYELQAAKTKQRIKDEQMQIKVVERTQEILVQEQEIQRRERELDSTVRRPAEAEKYRQEKLAEANKNRVIMEAEAEAESRILRHVFLLVAFGIWGAFFCIGCTELGYSITTESYIKKTNSEDI